MGKKETSRTQTSSAIGLVVVFAVGLAAPGCRREGSTTGEPSIENEPLVTAGAPAPAVHFPQELRVRDPSLNLFVEQALEVCAQGDYDGFRQLFAVATSPPGRSDFERIWHAVRDIEVVQLEPLPDSEREGQHYAHAVVRYREPDREGRLEREVVVILFKEAGRWRLAPAPTAVTRNLRSAMTQPATREAAGEDSP